MIYQARVKSNNTEETYIGLTSTTFKSRLGNHHKAMKNSKYRHDTALSLHIWDLKDKGEEFEVDWKFIGRANPFSPISRLCNLCTLEKYHILFNPNQASLNKREEFTNFCLHKRKLLLDNTWIPWDLEHLPLDLNHLVAYLLVFKLCPKSEGTFLFLSWNRFVTNKWILIIFNLM